MSKELSKVMYDNDIKQWEGFNGFYTVNLDEWEVQKHIERLKSKLKEAEEENRVLRIDNASYKATIDIERNKLQAVKDSLYTDEDIESESNYRQIEGADKESYSGGLRYQRDRTLKAMNDE